MWYWNKSDKGETRRTFSRIAWLILTDREPDIITWLVYKHNSIFVKMLSPYQFVFITHILPLSVLSFSHSVSHTSSMSRLDASEG